ncbi:hypothetical protein ACLESD_09025, partial [Pyxidicoccus sp. 3LFB2]
LRPGGRAARCPDFLAALERCLEVAPPPPDAQGLAGLVRLVTSAAPVDRARQWAWAVASLWPVPLQLQDFEAWRKCHEPLGPLLGPALTAHQAGQWKALVTAAPARTAEHVSEQLRLSQGVLAPHEAVESLLASSMPEDLVPRVERLILMKTAYRSVWKQDALGDAPWNQRLRKLLAVPPQGYASEVHGPLIADLTQKLQGWPGSGTALRAWALALVETLPPPVRVEGLGWWLDSLQGVAAALGPDLQRVASTALTRHLGALRDAQQRQAPLWEQIVESWQGLRLTRSSLEALVAPPAPAAPAGQTQQQTKKGKKR